MGFFYVLFFHINQKSMDPEVLFRDFMYLSYFLNHHNFCQQRGSIKKDKQYSTFW